MRIDNATLAFYNTRCILIAVPSPFGCQPWALEPSFCLLWDILAQYQWTFKDKLQFSAKIPPVFAFCVYGRESHSETMKTDSRPLLGPLGLFPACFLAENETGPLFPVGDRNSTKHTRETRFSCCFCLENRCSVSCFLLSLYETVKKGTKKGHARDICGTCTYTRERKQVKPGMYAKDSV